ncbi:YgaP-like transmembrane domain [Haloplanus sp. GCM10025708]|uniref:YgaP-like transmembrane domain n=1 Tax=Haloferacaceae TaxID=1644056 RepID=UPI003620F544
MGVKNNIGATDRRTRIVVGLGLVVVGLSAASGLLGLGTTVGVVLTLLGLVLVGTGLVRVCLLYRLLGIDTSGSR